MKYLLYSFILFALSLGFIPKSQAATFMVATATELIDAITAANSNGESDTIELTANIVLNTVNNTTDGPNGLPAILPDGGSSLTIEGNGHSISRVIGAPFFRFFHKGANTNLILNNLELANGYVIDSAGFNEGLGGAIFNVGGSLSLNELYITNSIGMIGGGALAMLDGTVTISNSTFFFNLGSLGGAISIINGTLNMNNSTISGNFGTNGGGIYFQFGNVALNHVTITGNFGAGGGGIRTEVGAMTVNNSIIAGNSLGECLDNSPITGSHNIIGVSGNSTFCGAFLSNSFPAPGPIATLLAPLANNGGATQTHALVAGSPAIDAALQANCTATDQRGIPRSYDRDGVPNSPQIADCDIGAFEDNSAIETDLEITKAVAFAAGGDANGDGLYNVGELVEYSIGVLNNGGVFALGTTLVDNIPTSITVISWTASFSGGATGATSGTGVLNQTIDLPPLSGATYTLLGVINSNAGATINNTATISNATVTESDATDNSAAANLNLAIAPTPVSPVPIVLPNGETVVVHAETDYVFKTVDNPFATVGQTVTYTIRARNPKTIPLTQVVIYDVFDERLTDLRLISTSHGAGVFNGNTLTVSGFILQPGEEALIVVSARVAALRVGETIPNAAILESPNASVHVSNLALVGANPDANSGGAAQVFLIPSQLPSTGESPFSHSALMISLLSAFVLGFLALGAKFRSHKQN